MPLDTPKKKRGGASPKRRGDKYERDIAQYFSTEIFREPNRVRRAPLSGGGAHILDSIRGAGTGQADLVGTTGIHVECKRTNRLRPYDALAQAESSIRVNNAPEVPVVITRTDGIPDDASLVIMRLKDWRELYEAWLKKDGHL